MGEVKIILVDDHQLVLDGLSSLLMHSVFKVSATFTSGEAALDFLEHNNQQINIVISDISMPAMSGIELCKKIKGTYSHISVIMLSMHSTTEAINQSISAEADGFLLKNSNKQQFFDALAKVNSGATYFSEEILPIIYKQMLFQKNKKSIEQQLSEREIEILKLISQELTSEEIAERLYISKKTVDNHRANMLIKTESKSTIGLLKYAIQNCLVNV